MKRYGLVLVGLLGLASLRRWAVGRAEYDSQRCATGSGYGRRNPILYLSARKGESSAVLAGHQPTGRDAPRSWALLFM